MEMIKARIKGNSVSFLSSICEKKMKSYFPAGVPGEVSERLSRELTYIDKAGDADIWRIYYEFNDTARKHDSIICSGSSTGNSIATFLLGNAPIDPMKAYYYCEKCGHYERCDCHDGGGSIPLSTFGIERPEKACPRCGEEMSKRGFGLPEVFTWGQVDNPKNCDFEYDYPRWLLAFLQTKLQRLYPDNEVIVCRDTDMVTGKTRSITGFAVLPDGACIKADYPEYVGYTEDGDIVFSGNHFEKMPEGIIFIWINENDVLNKVMEMQGKTGICYYELHDRGENVLARKDFINTGFLCEEEAAALSKCDSASLFDITEAFAMAHDTYQKDGNDSLLPKGKRFYTKESLYEQLLYMGKSQKDAYKITEFVRKGKASGRKDTWEDMCKEYKLPKDFAAFCAGYKYMGPRVYALVRVYLLSICSAYMKRYPNLYFRSCWSRGNA